MPQKRGFLNALASLKRHAARKLGAAPAPGARLDAAAFLAHARALARQEPSPPGLWLSLLIDGDARAQESGVVEIVRCDPRLTDPAARWREALARARAPYVARLTEGRLAPLAAERIAAALAAHPGAQALYTDEIETAAGRPATVVLKPAFDPVLLESFDYFGRLAVFARELTLSLGGWRDGSAGADYELAEAAAAATGAALHLPYPAFIGPPRASAPRRPALALPTWPKISVVIPSRDSPALIARTLAGLFEETDYPDFDVTVVDNGSTDPETLAIYARYASPRFRVDIEPAPFNFSQAVNRGAALADGALLLLLNNDVEMLEPGWLKEMAACLSYPRAGIVGAKLLYPDGTLQHAGVIAGLGGYAGHWHIGQPEATPGPQGRLRARQSLSAVTAACLLVSRECFDALGGFDAESFPIAYNDVDFCLRAGAAGWRVVWTPFARLVHHESASRGSDETPANRARFARDKAALRARHGTDVLEDRAYNPWAARSHSDPWPMARADLPKPRF